MRHHHSNQSSRFKKPCFSPDRANYFLLRNGEFSLAMIREFERLKVSRLSARSAVSSMIREQDLDVALLRASLGTSAQHDPSLSNLHFHLPSGPMRPLLPPLLSQRGKEVSVAGGGEETRFDDALLGTPLMLKYNVTWPLDLFLHTSDLNAYAALYAYLSALRKTHVRIHTCWTSLSNAQRARRKWTGLGEGGTAEDLEARRNLLRCGWGVARDMEWFLDVLLNYVMTDVVDNEFRRLKTLLMQPVKEFVARSRHNSVSVQSRAGGGGIGDGPDLISRVPSSSQGAAASATTAAPTHLDFTTLRNIHSTYLERLLTGSLLANPQLTAIIRAIFDICERFVAQVERWGGDILPPLLFEGSVVSGGGGGAEYNSVGAVVRERHGVVAEISEVMKCGFYTKKVFSNLKMYTDPARTVLLIL
jgi:gamma-tubulin complex component 4